MRRIETVDLLLEPCPERVCVRPRPISEGFSRDSRRKKKRAPTGPCGPGPHHVLCIAHPATTASAESASSMGTAHASQKDIFSPVGDHWPILNEPAPPSGRDFDCSNGTWGPTGNPDKDFPKYKEEGKDSGEPSPDWTYFHPDAARTKRIEKAGDRKYIETVNEEFDALNGLLVHDVFPRFGKLAEEMEIALGKADVEMNEERAEELRTRRGGQFWRDVEVAVSMCYWTRKKANEMKRHIVKADALCRGNNNLNTDTEECRRFSARMAFSTAKLGFVMEEMCMQALGFREYLRNPTEFMKYEKDPGNRKK